MDLGISREKRTIKDLTKQSLLMWIICTEIFECESWVDPLHPLEGFPFGQALLDEILPPFKQSAIDFGMRPMKEGQRLGFVVEDPTLSYSAPAYGVQAFKQDMTWAWSWRSIPPGFGQSIDDVTHSVRACMATESENCVQQHRACWV